MDDTVQNWLDAYLRAWASNERADIEALFTEDARYAGSPLDPEPWVGRQGIVDGWLAHRDEPGTWSFEGAPLIHSDGIGVVQGITRYDDGRTYANLWVITFADDRRARDFVEWYMEPTPVREDQA
ncbi:nuclear transport factor 2 family protein [uncultured Microbacterium sp.]|uniref:nuclear transport factor 2 family protein n=1 Tax=uncultured Microbacterium sp. TaxID=191216 RepID=UPI0035C9C064